MCDGETHLFSNDVSVSHIVFHHEEILTVEDATIVIDRDKMLHKE